MEHVKRVLVESMPFDPDLKAGGGGGGGRQRREGGGGGGGSAAAGRGERLAGHISRLIVNKSRALVKRELSSSSSSSSSSHTATAAAGAEGPMVM